jgi:hypothetical protein
MVEQFFNPAADERVQVPKLVNLDEVRVITGQREVGVVLQKQIGDIVQMHEPVECGRAEAVVLAQFVAQQRGGLVHVVNQQRIFGRGLRDVMVNDHPLRFVEARFEGEIRDPRGPFAQFALFPLIVMIGFERYIRAVQLFGEPLQQGAGKQAVEVAFVSDDDIGFGWLHHDGKRLIQSSRRGEW